MDANKTFAKIIELGKNSSKREELQEYCKLKIDQIVSFLPRRILNSDGAGLLDCILNGLSDEPSGMNKVKIIDVVLNTLRKESTSLTHGSDIMSRVLPELPRQSVTNLVRWCDDCVQSIVEDSDKNMIWKDILPEHLNTIASYNSVNHCGTDLTGADYKQQCIRTLCQCKWKDHQLVQLTAMFREMELSKNDHKQVVNKICSHIMGLTPAELPPLVHQLVRLCKLYNLEIVLAHLSHYFNLHLYSKLEPPPQDSESTTIDIDDLAQYSPAELSSCLSTCIYHMTQGAAEHDLIKKHIKTWPKTQLLHAPFLIDIALAVSDKGAEFKSVCLDAIKSAIEQRALDELRCKQSACVRSVLPPDVDVVSVLKVLTAESANHRELTVLGLINLAFSLLGVSRVKPVATVLWSHGKLVLVRLCKAQPATTRHILTQLADRLCADVTQRQYSECLYILCKLTPVSVEPCPQLNLILESCQPAGAEYESAALVLAAVHPLLGFSTRVRDALVMVCRKGLYARESLHRCLSVSGFLTVLRHIKLCALPTSQGSGDQLSAHSYLTQLTVDVHATQNGAVTSRVRNEAMCMEVVSILRRCLVQDANVKQLFYTELYECVKDKPALHEAVLELLYEHLSKYLPEDEDEAGILLDDCVQVTATSAVLTEPISRLLYLVAQFLQPVEEDLEDILSSPELETASAHLKSKLLIIMEKLCTADNFVNIDMEDVGVSDLTPESMAKCMKVQQALACQEALVAHLVMQWNPTTRSAPTIIYNIYKASAKLMDQTKTPSKQARKNAKLANETGDTAKSQKSQKTQKDKTKGPNKLSNMVKDRAGPFKPLPCLWDLKFCLRILVLLYSEEVSWSSVEQRNQLRCRRDLQQWAVRGVQAALAALAAAGRARRQALPHLASIAALLYRRCLIRFQDLCDFDEQTALGCLDIFKTCMNLILTNNFSLKLESLVPHINNTITGLTETTVAASIANILEHVHTALAQLNVDAEDVDETGKKILASLCQLAALLLETPLQPSAEMSRVIIKLEDYVRRSRQDCQQLLLPLLGAACREQHEAQLLEDLLEKLATALGRIDEEDSSEVESDTFPSIESKSGCVALSHVCAHLTHRLKCVEHLLNRARDLASALDSTMQPHQARIEKEMREVYRSVVVELCRVCGWAGGAARLRAAAGVLPLCVRLYALLAALLKHIQPEIAVALRLDRLLKISGKRLSSVMDCFITYLEQQQQQQGGRNTRDSRLVPRLVLEAEQFNKHAILLANKAKVDYQQYFSLGFARDFKIKASLLQEVLSAREDHTDNASEEDINDAATEIIPLTGDNEDNQNEDVPLRKKRRVS